MKNFLQFLRRAWRYFRGTRRVWRRPPQSDLLIIDRGTASPLDEMFAHHNPHIMDIRGESINMLALLRALPKVRLGAVAYLEAYIDFVKPKLVLSRNGDSDLNLWRIKRRMRINYKVVLVQNGWRPDRFGAIPIATFERGQDSIRPAIDCALVFGPVQADSRLLQYADNVLGIGSTKLNQIDFSKPKMGNKKMVFISEYRHQEFLSNPDFYGVDAEICQFLAKFAIKNQLSIDVAGVMSGIERLEGEKNWFAKHFAGADWHYQEKQNSLSSYELINAAEMVVTVDSTMGYESISIGKKTAILCCRRFTRSKGREGLYDLLIEKSSMDLGGTANNRFGASDEFEDSGFFWSNIRSPDEWYRVLTNVIESSPDEFERICRPYADQLMVHDYGNTKIRAYVEGVLTDSLENK